MDRWRKFTGARTGALLVTLMCGLLTMPAFGQAERNLERGVKAAFLYKFAGYVEWPAGSAPAADAPLVIAVAHEAALADVLERLVPGRRIGNHPILVRRVKDGESLAGIHILFIGATEKARTASLIRAAQAQPTLVVTELENGLALGSGINFVLIDGRVRFEASAEAVEKSGLKLSSRLLSVAANARAVTTQ
ncbi:MAG: YfiR family protein [Betaproteobacteria bacterium]